MYLDWAATEDPGVTVPAYQAAYGNLSTQPACGSTWGSGTTPCFGINRGGESPEGSWYRYSTYRTRYLLNILHTAGYDDPILYGPQMSYGTSSWWDLHYIAELSFLTGIDSGHNPNAMGEAFYNFTTGDTYQSWRSPNDYWDLAATLSYDTMTGRSDRSAALEWAPLNVAGGGPNGTTYPGCTSYCGFVQNMSNDIGNNIIFDFLFSLPATDPTVAPPADPRPNFPTDWYDAGNQHILVRSGWSTAGATGTAFSYYAPNTAIDHEDELAGRFDIYSNGEYITKGRIVFVDYNYAMAAANANNEASYMQPANPGCSSWGCFQYGAYLGGGEIWHAIQNGTLSLNHSELPGYVGANLDLTPVYNTNLVGGYPYFTSVPSASRSLVYLRATNQVVYYDRGTTATPQAHYLSLITTGPLTINGNTATWPTRSGNQKACYTSLLGGTLSDAGLPTGRLPTQKEDWQPYTTIRVSAGKVIRSTFLSTVEWGASSFSCSATSLINSSAGQTFQGAMIGSSLVMFSQTYPAAFAGTTFPASGATSIYISDLAPSTTYTITGAGTPASAITDTAGVLTFAAVGTGNITVNRKSKSGTLPNANQRGDRSVIKPIFWLSLSGVLYTYVGYPTIMWMMSKLRPKPWIATPVIPSVSIVLAVHNGVALLPRQIQHLLALDYPHISEIIIVSDGSTDGTGEVLASRQHPQLRTIVLKEHRGKAVAVNAGVAEATADVVVFVDIRPEIAPGAIQQLVSNFADAKVGCVSGNLKLRDEGHDATSAAVGGFYWRYEQWLRTCEAASDSPVGVYGGFYAIRRTLYVQQPAGIILDDMFQPLSIIRQGYRSVVDPRAYVYDTWPKESRAEFHRKVRTLAGNFQLFQLMPWTLTPRNRLLFQLVSHKGMRLVVPYLLLLLLVSAMLLSPGSPAFTIFAAIQIVGWALAVVALRYRIPGLHRVAAPASAFLMLNAAAVVGFYKFLFTRGPLWKIWNAGKPQNRTSSIHCV